MAGVYMGSKTDDATETAKNMPSSQTKGSRAMVNTVLEVRGQWIHLFEASKRQILKYYSLWMDNRMFTDLCREGSAAADPHTPTLTHKTHTHTDSAMPGQYTGGWNNASARHGKVTGLRRCHLPQVTGLHLWQGQHKQKSAQLHTTASVLWTPLHS